MIPAAQRWPADVAQRYRERGYWAGETLGAWFSSRAREFSSRVAVVAGSDRWTYDELERRADAMAAGFLASGLRPGDRVIVQLPNLAVFFSTVLGLFRAGILPVFALPAHRRTEITHFATVSEARALIVADVLQGFDYRGLAEDVCQAVPAITHVFVTGDPGRFHSLDQLAGTAAVKLPDQAPDAVAFFQLSGGSTGLSKLIPRTHDDYLYSVRASAEICGVHTGTVYLAVLPVAHNFPMSSPGFLGVLHAGGTVVLSPSPAPDVAFPLIARERVTMAALVPPLALVWLEEAARTTVDLSSLRVVQVGGAKLTPEVARRIGPGLGATLQQVFGMAEGLVNYTRLDDPLETIVTTQGRPISPDDEVLIVDDEDVPVAPGEPGNLLTRGPYTIRAYHNAPEANQAAFTSDGYYRTGDIVRRTPDGYFVVMGRAADQINRGGEKISAEEIEDHLVAHPAVFDAIVVSVPDRYLGERACAFVVPRGQRPTVGELKAWIRGRGVAAFKVPDQVVFVDEFPVTGALKTSRKTLRADLQERWKADRAAAAGPQA